MAKSEEGILWAIVTTFVKEIYFSGWFLESSCTADSKYVPNLGPSMYFFSHHRPPKLKYCFFRGSFSQPTSKSKWVGEPDYARSAPSNFFSTKNVRWGAVHSLTIPINENALWQLKLQDQQLFFIKRNCLLKTLSSSVYWMGPVYLVIFCYWVGPVPYLELFGAGPVEKNTL